MRIGASVAWIKLPFCKRGPTTFVQNLACGATAGVRFRIIPKSSLTKRPACRCCPLFLGSGTYTVILSRFARRDLCGTKIPRIRQPSNCYTPRAALASLSMGCNCLRSLPSCTTSQPRSICAWHQRQSERYIPPFFDRACSVGEHPDQFSESWSHSLPPRI